MIPTFAALAEPNRFRIVELLRGGPRSVNAIGARLRIRQPQVSKHLKLLKEVGLVAVQQQAQQRVYELRPEPLRQLHEWLDRYRAIWDERFEVMDEILHELQAKERADARRKRK